MVLFGEFSRRFQMALDAWMRGYRFARCSGDLAVGGAVPHRSELAAGMGGVYSAPSTFS